LRQSHPLRAGVVCPHTAPLPIAAAPNAIADDRAVDKREDNSSHAAPRCSATAIRPKQVVDVLTDRLLDQEPTLLEPRVQPRRKAEADTVIPPPKVESIVLQRNQLETAALSVAAMRGASWSAIRLLLRPKSGIEIVSLLVSECLTQGELHQPGVPPKASAAQREVQSTPPAAQVRPSAGVNIVTNQFSFNDLSVRCRSLGLGVLIGWRRDEDDANHDAPKSYKIGVAYDATELNPLNKEEKLMWHPTNQLIVMRREDGLETPVWSRESQREGFWADSARQELGR